MSTDHHQPHVEDWLPGYALGALDPAEQAEIEAHLRACSPCSQLLDEYRSVGQALLEIPAPVEPRPLLRQSLASGLATAGARPQQPLSWRRLVTALAAVFLIVAAANLYLINQVAQVRNALSSLESDISTNQTALAINSYPTTRVASLEGEQAFGTFMFDPSRTIAVLYAWGLPSDSGDAQYAAWLTTAGGERVNVGIFPPDESGRFTMVVLRSPDPIAGYEAVGVSRFMEGDVGEPAEPILFTSLEADD